MSRRAAVVVVLREMIWRLDAGSRTRQTGLIVCIGALVAASLTVFASPASADPGPILDRPATGTATADALPTTQIDGVAWSQAIVGDTVFVGGKFTSARPAGAAAGTGETPRANLLAYSLSTGTLITTFAPTTDGQVLAVAASADGSRLYIAGDFTTVNGVRRNRIAAVSTSNGALISGFGVSVDSRVKALAVVGDTIYAGGLFTTANGTTRTRVAAFTSAGGLLPWDPNADGNVNALVVSPTTGRVILGGAFQNVGGTPAYGMAAVDPTTGALQQWNTTNLIRNAGADAAITSLTTDGSWIYGTGYVYGSGGNLEGMFSANPTTGDIHAVEDCHGDTYGAYSTGSVVYTVSHAHYCGNVGGFPQTSPTWTLHHALAFTTDVTGTLGRDPLGYYNFEGTPSPSLINWFPDFTTGKITGQSQAGWTVTGNGQYIAVGGEFPTVNGTAQAGLVRFAVPSKSTNKQGPRISGANAVPSLVSLSAGTVRVAFQANWDRDDKTLTYRVTRDGNTATPVYTTTADSTFWNRPYLGFTDTGLVPGRTYKYRLYASDPSGNTAVSDYVSIVASATNSQTAYGKKIAADGANAYYPLNETSGTTVFDNIAFNDMVAGSGVTRGAAGAIAGDTASTFDGTSNGVASTRAAIAGPNTFTLSSWLRTTSTSGGKIVGFGSVQNGDSSSYDRHVYLDNAGHVWFGVYNNTVSTLNSVKTVNDGQWHQVVASMGAAGMALYVDGVRVAKRADVTTGQDYSGFWRVGGDNLNGWSNQPSSGYLAGDIDEVAVFPTQLSGTTVQDEWQASGRASTLPSAPGDNYGAAVYRDDPTLYYRFGESSGSTVTDSGQYSDPGTYQGGYTLGADGAVKGTADTAVTFDGNSGVAVSSVAVSNPLTYSEEAWFRTTTTRGGKIIGFGDATSGLSGNYDRHVYMQDNGQIVFGTYTGQLNTITSQAALNDGKWHHVVATQDSVNGMRLYVDGQLGGTNPQTSAQNYTGYWRIGGDNTWGSSSAYFAGTIDEAAVYSTALTADQVANHYNLGSTTVAVNNPPTAAFTSSASDLTASFDGSGSTDDGSIAGYSWDFGDGQTGTGATPSHAYANGGTYTVTLTVTDDKGATGQVSHQVSVVAPNRAPAAAFVSSTDALTASFDATASADPDGTIAGYSWDFGDGTSGTGMKPTHAYAGSGTYTVALTVTDNQGATNTVTHAVTVTRANSAPVAAFTATPTNLTVSFDGTSSSDPDGTVAGWAWNFGDSTTGTGSTVSHNYAAAGTYTVALTVTDNSGATNTVNKAVTVTAPASPVVAKDTFGRSIGTGWGNADTGGSWTVAGGTFSVSSGAGRAVATKAGAAPLAVLASVNALNTDSVVDFALDKAPTGGGNYIALIARRNGNTDYRLQVVVKATSTTLSVVRVVNNVETAVKTATISGMTYTAGSVWHLRFDVSGSGTTTLTGKVWKDGAAQPTAWQVSATDTDPTLQAAGAVGVRSYLSSSSTSAPVVTTIDNVAVTALP